MGNGDIPHFGSDSKLESQGLGGDSISKVKPSIVVIHACNLSAKEAETEDPWSALAIQTYLGVMEWAEV